MTKNAPVEQRLTASGHLIDSGLMSRYLGIIQEAGGSYEIVRMDVGRSHDDVSQLELLVEAPDLPCLESILDNLLAQGCSIPQENEISMEPSPKDGTVPDDFYSTTNHPTEVFHGDQWLRVADQRMDACIVVAGGLPRCVKLRDVAKGDAVVVGHEGIRVHPEAARGERAGFAFMDNEVSSERAVERVVEEIAGEMRSIRQSGGRTVLVTGPVVIHTGGVPPLSRILRGGYIHAILSGNALGVHDAELALFGTSLGVDLATGRPVAAGHRNHMRAINAVCKAGSLARAVEMGVLTSGLFYEIHRQAIPFCLAGSIRDDGPLPDTVTDMIAAQAEYARLLETTSLCLMLASMLHAIGTGNMLPSTCRTVCVDINPAVVTKLADRGSAQATGLVTDVGLFLTLLADRLGT
ncbi:MAG: TIGR00300 family protein [Acidobacteriota bacterium]